MVVEIGIIYYIKNNYMFRPFSLAIFRLINEKLSKQLHLTCVGCIQWGGKMWSGEKRAETCSCSLCNKLYISLPPYSCDRQVYTFQSSLL